MLETAEMPLRDTVSDVVPVAVTVVLAWTARGLVGRTLVRVRAEVERLGCLDRAEDVGDAREAQGRKGVHAL